MQYNLRRFPARAGAAVVVLAMASLAACAPRVQTVGNLPRPEKIEQIQPGVDNKVQVAQKLGTPSSVATFDKNTWYYIGKKTESLAFFEPKVMDQKVIVVTFNGSGTVSKINKFGLKDGRNVQISKRISPTQGREMTLLQQLYSNLLRGARDTGANEGFVP